MTEKNFETPPHPFNTSVEEYLCSFPGVDVYIEKEKESDEVCDLVFYVSETAWATRHSIDLTELDDEAVAGVTALMQMWSK